MEAILSIKRTRLTRICFERQLRLHYNTDIDVKYDWMGQLAEFLDVIGMSDILLDMNLLHWKNLRKTAFKRYFIYLKFSDLVLNQ